MDFPSVALKLTPVISIAAPCFAFSADPFFEGTGRDLDHVRQAVGVMTGAGEIFEAFRLAAETVVNRRRCSSPMTPSNSGRTGRVCFCSRLQQFFHAPVIDLGLRAEEPRTATYATRRVHAESVSAFRSRSSPGTAR